MTLEGVLEEIELKIYNLTGELIKKINKHQLTKKQDIIWEYELNVKEMASGVYFCLLQVKDIKGNQRTSVKKLAVIH